MISYKPLLRLLIDRDMKLTDLAGAGLSSTIIAKFKKDAHVNTATLDKICEFLNCDISDVIEYVPEKNKKK